MSHLHCPFCGKYAHRENWNPEDYDNDIRVASFAGKGYRMGFEKTEYYSVLGDEYVTPRIIDRMINLFEFLIKEEIVDPNILIQKLNLEKIIVEKGNYIKNDEHMTLCDKYISLQKEFGVISISNDSFKGAYHKTMEKYEKDKKNNERVRRILHWLIRNCNAALILDEELDYVIRIDSIEPNIVSELDKIRMETSEDVKKILRKRIKVSSLEIGVILGEFFLKKTTSIAERLLNLEFKPL